MIKTAILTISDTRNKDTDTSGKAIQEILRNKEIFKISTYEIVTDDRKKIKERLIYYSDVLKVDLILTTGGTGLGLRDVTPEATLGVIEKAVPGIPELIRNAGYKKTKTAVLSRGAAGIRKGTLIINLPGSPKGVQESLSFILEIIPHSIDMLKGKGHASH